MTRCGVQCIHPVKDRPSYILSLINALSNTQCDYDTRSTCYICTVNIFINNARSLTDYTLMELSSLFGQIKASVTASSAVRYL